MIDLRRNCATIPRLPPKLACVIALVFAGLRFYDLPSPASEPAHAYLNGDRVVHYSLESGTRGFVRRIDCDIAGDRCRLARFPYSHYLIEQAHYPIRIKEEGRFLWSIWPGERVVEQPQFKRRIVPRNSPIPEFPITRDDIAVVPGAPVTIESAATAEVGREFESRNWRRESAEQYPVTAMFKSRFLDLEVVVGVPLSKNFYPFDPAVMELSEWAKKAQPEFARFGSYDLLPTSKGGLRMFLVMQGSDNGRYILPPSNKPRMYELEAIPAATMPEVWKWRVVDHYETDFVDRFLVVDSNEQRWFASGDGRLHRLTRAGESNSICHESLRDDRKIELIIEEAGDPRRAYAFTSDRWFELKVPIIYRELAWEELSEESPTQAIRRCAAEIRRHYRALQAPDSPSASESVQKSKTQD
jgi:hypothetical protein